MIIFSSNQVGSILFFRAHAEWILKAMKTSGHVPGALQQTSIPFALTALKNAYADLQQKEKEGVVVDQSDRYATNPPQVHNELLDDENIETSHVSVVPLSHRVIVFIEFLEKVVSAKGDLMWVEE